MPYMPTTDMSRQLENIENEVNAFPEPLKSSVIRFRRFMSAYSPQTKRVYVQRVLRFIRYLHNRENNNNYDITSGGDIRRIKEDIADYKIYLDTRTFESSNRPLKHASGREVILALQLFYRGAYDIRIIPPGEKMKEYFNLLHNYRSDVDLITDAEFERLIDFAPNRLWKALVSLMGTSGARIGEIFNIRLRDMFFEENRLHIEFGKGGVERSTMFSPQAQHYVNEYLLEREILKSADDYVFWANPEKRRRLNHTFVYFGLLKIGKAANIQRHIYPHLLRHYCFTKWHNMGVNMKTIQRCAGHANIGVTGTYITMSNRDLAEFFMHPPV
jgi:integrase/recombinase XerD